MGSKLPKEARIVVTLDNGSKVRLWPVSSMLISQVDDAVEQRWADRGKVRIEYPSYEITTAAGDKEIHRHDTESIAAVEDEAERTRLYAQVEAAAADDRAFTRERSEILMDLACGECVEVIEGPSMDKWVKARTRMGLHTPDDEEERKLLFAREYILTTTRDITSVITGMLELSGVSKRSVDAASANFRDPVEGREATEGPADPAGAVEVPAGEPVQSAEGGEVVGEAAQ